MAITRGNMRSTVQRRIGDTASTSFYATALYNDVIDQSVSTTAIEVTRLNPNYYLKHKSYTGVDDATDSLYEFYNFPSDFMTFVKLERQFPGTGGLQVIYQTIRKVNAEDQDRYRIGFNLVLLLPDSMQNFQQTVSDWGTQFRIVPPPSNNSYLYRMRYLYRPVAASDDNQNLAIPDEWIEYVALDCGVSILSTIGDPIAEQLRKNRDEEFAQVRRNFRRHYLGSEGIGTLDQMT